jgi:hypothetical protein
MRALYIWRNYPSPMVPTNPTLMGEENYEFSGKNGRDGLKYVKE